MGYRDGIAVPYSAYTDYLGARYVAMAIIAALEYHRRTGRGQYIDHSQV
jgi:benzylsuccinate CoA-transferase BbsF subunit